MPITALAPIVAASDFGRGVRLLDRVDDDMGLTFLAERHGRARDHSPLL
jgi:hypothetical protein